MMACDNDTKELALALVELGADIEATNNVSKVGQGHCMTHGVSREEFFRGSRSVNRRLGAVEPLLRLG